MDTPVEEQQMFQNVTCKIAASEDEITEPNTLSEEFIASVSELTNSSLQSGIPNVKRFFTSNILYRLKQK